MIIIINIDCCYFIYLKLDIEVFYVKVLGKGLINLFYILWLKYGYVLNEC